MNLAISRILPRLFPPKKTTATLIGHPTLGLVFAKEALEDLAQPAHAVVRGDLAAFAREPRDLLALGDFK